MSARARIALLALLLAGALLSMLVLRASEGERSEPERAEQEPEPLRTNDVPAAAARPSRARVVDAEPAFDPERADEAAVMARAVEALRRAPAEALRLVEIADRRFGMEHMERRALEIDALVGLQRIGEARDKAELFHRYYPGTDEAARIERLTGAHPRPSRPW